MTQKYTYTCITFELWYHYIYFHLQPVMALFRPGPDSSRRPIFNWAHWGVGMTAYILSGKTVFLCLNIVRSHIL